MGDNDVTIGKVKFLDFSCSEGIRRSPELLSDQSLRCSSCGEGPLFKGRDLYVAFLRPGRTPGKRAQELPKGDATTEGRGVCVVSQHLLFRLY